MSDTEPTPRLLDPAHRFLLVGIVSLVTVVATESMAIVTVMPVVEDELGDLWLYGWVFSGFYLGTLFGVVVAGRAVDRYRPVVPMVVGIGVFLIGLAVGGMAPNMAVLVLGRVLQGTGGGAVPVVAYVCVSRGFPAVLRPRAFAVMSTAWVLPSLLSPVAAAEVSRQFGWRWVFLGLIPVTVAVACVGIPAVRTVADAAPADPAASRGGEAPRSSLAAVSVLVLGVALILGGLGAELWWLGAPLAVLGAAVALRPFRTLTPAGTLRARPGIPAAVMTRGVLTFAFFSVDAFLSLAITGVRESTTRYAGTVLAVSSLTWTAGSWIQARLAERWGAPRLVAAGGMCIAVGIVVLGIGLSDAVPLAAWFPGGMLTGLGMGLAYPQLSVVTLAFAPPGGEGFATSALQMTDLLGIALGTGVAGVVVSVGDRLGAPLWAAILVVFAGSAVAAMRVSSLAPRLRAD